MKTSQVLLILFLVNLAWNAPVLAQKISSVRIVGIEIADQGDLNASTPFQGVDISQGECGSGTTLTPEQFTDTLGIIKIVNKSKINLRLDSARIIIKNELGKKIVSPKFALLGQGIDVLPKSETTVYALLFDKVENQKVIPRTGYALTSALGFRNVTFEIFGRTATRKKFSLTAKTAISFDNIDRCK